MSDYTEKRLGHYSQSEWVCQYKSWTLTQATPESDLVGVTLRVLPNPRHGFRECLRVGLRGSLQ